MMWLIFALMQMLVFALVQETVRMAQEQVLMGAERRRELLSKGTPAAAGSRAGKPPHAQLKTNTAAKQWKISGSAPVIPVDGG